jgi:mono/diheme cytochrome c family protein
VSEQMSKAPFIVFGLFAALCVLVIPILALGKEGGEQAGIVEVADRDRDSKQLFATNCGPCHTLAAAGTDGIVGPDLDDLLVTSGVNSAETYEASYPRVLQAITCGVPPGGGRMPPNILLGDDATEVAAFVAAYAGQIGSGPVVDTATASKPSPDPCPEPATAAESG